MLDMCMQEQQHVEIAPSHLVERRFSEWQGLTADVVEVRQRVPFDYRFRSNRHLLIAAEHSERDEGETLVEGLPRSTLHTISGKLTWA